MNDDIARIEQAWPYPEVVYTQRKRERNTLDLGVEKAKRKREEDHNARMKSLCDDWNTANEFHACAKNVLRYRPDRIGEVLFIAEQHSSFLKIMKNGRKVLQRLRALQTELSMPKNASYCRKENLVEKFLKDL